jgi:putative ABC transport system substrate-binding protein
VAVLATVNTPSVLAAKMATQTIPIIFAVGVDPVEFGLAASLNRPGGNLTGITQLNVEMDAKRLQLLQELVPGAKLIGLLINPASPAYSAVVTREAEAAARVLGVKLLVLSASNESSIEAAFVSLVQNGAGALLVSGDSFFVVQRDQLVALAAKHRVPTMYHRREFTISGGLLSYGPSLSEAYRHLGDYTGRILKGEKPGELPVHQSARFDLAINLRLAKVLGIDVPTSILLRADEVME